MEISTVQTPRYALVQLAGELRADEGPRFTDELHPLIAEADSAMVVDMSQVTWVDSGGLSLLISLVTHARLCRSRVVLVNPGKFVAGVLEVTQLDKWFELAADVADAEKRLAK